VLRSETELLFYCGDALERVIDFFTVAGDVFNVLLQFLEVFAYRI
jgi:hypothetical protein